MIIYIISAVISFSIGIFVKYEYTKTCCDILIKKYNGWKRLNKLVSTKYKSPLMINWISFIMVCESLYLKIILYLNNSVKKLDKNKYEVSYIINGKFYKMVTTTARGPIPVIQIMNEDNIDVTEYIIPYMGPNNDWHNRKYFPDFFNYKSLIFELSNGERKTFNHSETIILK